MIKDITPRVPELGKIKIGGKGDERTSKGGKKYRLPVKHSTISLTRTTKADPDGDFDIDLDLMGALGGVDEKSGEVRGLSEIPVVLRSDVIDEVFQTRWCWYSGRRVACTGDGEAATLREIRNGEHTGKTKERPCNSECEERIKGLCKPNGILRCSIVAPGQAVAGGIHAWRTTSINGIAEMIGSLQAIQSVTGGILTGLPLWLCIREKSAEKDGKTYRYWTLGLELRAKDVQELNETTERAVQMAKIRAQNRDEVASLQASYRRALKAPGENETPSEQQDVAEEFYPKAPPAEAPCDSEPAETEANEKRQSVGTDFTSRTEKLKQTLQKSRGKPEEAKPNDATEDGF